MFHLKLMMSHKYFFKMISIPDCVENVNLGSSRNCTDYIIGYKSGLISYNIQMVWDLNLTNETNEFEINTLNVSEIGYMLLYSFDSVGGRIALGSSPGNYSDFNMTYNGLNLTGPLNSEKYLCFGVLVTINPVQKFFTQWISKMYAFSGDYDIRLRLQDNSFGAIVKVIDGNHVKTYSLKMDGFFRAIILILKGDWE